jgi:hypothetical protein
MLALLLLVVSAPAVAEAQAPKNAGLVLEVAGSTTLALRPYTELAPGTVVKLGPAGRLVFVHYLSCRTVTVAGGTVTVDVDRYTATGTRSEARTPCPRAVTLKRGGETAGLLVRGMRPPRESRPGPPPLTLPGAPDLVLVGDRAAEVAAVTVAQGGVTVAEVRMNGPRLSWPRSAPALQPDATYDLVLSFKSPAASPVTLPFVVAPPGTASASPTILTVD